LLYKLSYWPNGGTLSADATHALERLWQDCNLQATPVQIASELCLMGYSVRTNDYRYTAYCPFSRTTLLPNVLGVHAGALPYEEELFDHRNETLADFTHRELINLAYRPPFCERS
jgi:hypothetical protein